MELEFVRQGLKEFGYENYKTSIDQFSKALEKNPNCIEAFIYRASSYEKLGNYNLAIEDLDKAQLEENYSKYEYDILYARAKILIGLNIFKPALEELKKAKEIENLTIEKISNLDKLINLVS